MWFAALSVLAGAYQAYGQAQAGRYNNKIAKYNAWVADAQARDAIARGAVEEQRFRTKVRGVIGSQRTGFAGQGVDVNTGIAADVQDQSEQLGEQDALTIRNNAAREAWGYKVQAKDSRMQGAMAQREGYQQAAGTLLTSGANFYRSYKAAT